MEKKMPVRPPSFMRGTSMLPSSWWMEMSNLGSRRRWVVSSWVSMTMEADCAEVETVIRTPRNRIAKERVIFSPGKSGNRVAEEELKNSRVQRQGEEKLAVKSQEPSFAQKPCHGWR